MGRLADPRASGHAPRERMNITEHGDPHTGHLSRRAGSTPACARGRLEDLHLGALGDFCARISGAQFRPQRKFIRDVLFGIRT